MGMSLKEEIGQLSLLFRFLLLDLSALSNILTALVVLDILIINGESLVNLGTKG